mmetsp:Transcript_3052/g.7596  ORF Transcript_3052/g.7596 Transcript_3052/m.7596 type:complete len:287 (-) Transcript_3052:636-1496(-)
MGMRPTTWWQLSSWRARSVCAARRRLGHCGGQRTHLASEGARADEALGGAAERTRSLENVVHALQRRAERRQLGGDVENLVPEQGDHLDGEGRVEAVPAAFDEPHHPLDVDPDLRDVVRADVLIDRHASPLSPVALAHGLAESRDDQLAAEVAERRELGEPAIRNDRIAPLEHAVEAAMLANLVVRGAPGVASRDERDRPARRYAHKPFHRRVMLFVRRVVQLRQFIVLWPRDEDLGAVENDEALARVRRCSELGLELGRDARAHLVLSRPRSPQVERVADVRSPR